MRDYQRKGKYILPKAVYHQVLWKIRDYYRLEEEAKRLLELCGVQYTDMPRGSTSSYDKIGNIVQKREEIHKTIHKIDDCLLYIPSEYRKGIWDNIHYQKAFPLDADRSTYGRYKSLYIYLLAKRFNLIS